MPDCFSVDTSEHPPLPSSVAFHIPIRVHNAIISRCIIDEGASTCVMSTAIWKQLKLPELSPSTITLRAWDGHSSQPLGMYHNCPMTLAGKIVHVDIEVIDAPLDYNILLGRSYTYAMSTFASAMFCKMYFPHEGKIVTVDQLTYYEPISVTSPESIISSVSDKQPSNPSTSVSPGVYKYSSLLGSFPGPPPPISEPNSMSVCMLQASWASLKQSSTPNQQPAPKHLIAALPAEPSDPPPRTSFVCGCLSYVSTRNCS